MTTALYTTRLGHSTALIDAAGGRHAAVTSVHNVPGISETTTGEELGEVAIDQVVEYGGDYYPDAVESVERVDADTGDATGADDPRFRVDAERTTLDADRVVLATGFSDDPPRVDGLRRFTGRGLHYCLHCDAYSLADGRVYVLGHDDHAARVAMILLNFTSDVDLLLNGRDPEWDDRTAAQVEGHPVDVIGESVDRAFPEGGIGDATGGTPANVGGPDAPADRPAEDDAEGAWLGGLEFADGTVREYTGGFAMYGSEYNNGIARQLGCELNDDGSVDVDGDRRTSVDGVYAVGDLTHGQNQTPIAMGDGGYAGVALHKDLRTFPLDPDALPEGGIDEADVPAAPDDLRARMRRLRRTGVDRGIRPPGDGR